MDINTSLEISWTPIVAYKNIEGKNPENSYFQFFVMTWLWCKIFELDLKRSFYQVFGHIMRKFGVYYTFWWKIVVPQSQNFSFFPFTFFIFYIFDKLLTSASFLFQINFSIIPFFIILVFQKYIRFLEQHKQLQSILYCHIFQENPFCGERVNCCFSQKITKQVRDRRQKTFEFFSRLCLLRGGGGQDKSAKNG